MAGGLPGVGADGAGPGRGRAGGSTVGADLAAALEARGLRPLGGEFPGIAVLTYTMLDLGYAPWVLWSTDAGAGEADLNARATEESFL